MRSHVRIDIFVRFAVQGIFSILRQHHISRASIFFRSFALIVHDSTPYKNIGKIKVRTSLDNVTRRRGAAVVGPDKAPHDSPESLPSVGQNSVVDNGPSEISSEQSLLHEIRLFREEMAATRSQMSILNDSLNKLTSRMDQCDKRIDHLSARVESLERQSTQRGEDRSTEKLLGSIEQLKTELNDRDQECLLNDIEISGIIEQKGESLPHIVMTIASKLGVKLVDEDLVSVMRVGPVQAPQESSSSSSKHSRPRLIVIRLGRRVLRDQLLKAARVRRGATTSDTGLPGPPQRFYVNERLTRVNRLLFRRTRELAGRFNWRFVWTSSGRIFVRQDHGTDALPLRIRTDRDLLRVFGSDAVGSTQIQNE